ncbi:endodeoxyribonuclease [Agrobacterium sp. rho-8.1]|nr:endodeoxyribonuclease [Agrobacterium sp. rho-8.1]
MRNKYEERVFKALPAGVEYEPFKMPYVLECNYLPDFVDVANKTIFEAKGYWRSQDRRKLLAVKAQYPDWKIVMVLQEPNKKITKKSKTSYSMWCEKNGLDWMKG